MAPILPEIHLLCMESKYSSAFNTAVQKIYPTLPSQTEITHHNCALKFLPQDLRFTAIVSPANSYARLDGAFDDALARAYGPKDDYDWITRKAQTIVYQQWRGFAPPGTCTVVPLGEGQPWGTRYLLLCPTMRVPDDVTWDREVVFECVWSLLCKVDEHNRKVRAGGGGEDVVIESLCMTPLATGVGRVSAQRWAEQCVLALKLWVEAVERPEVWGCLGWGKILEDSVEIERTYGEVEE